MQTADVRAASNDQEVLQLLRAGEAGRAFALLLPRFESKIYRLCYALLRERTQAQDAAQESLVRIWRTLHRYDGRAALSTWIYAITRNRCLSALERRRRADGARADVSAADDELAGMPVQLPCSDAGGPSSQQRDAQLRSLVDALPERLRRVLVLYYFEERSVDEVASMLGCPAGTVKTHLFRARAALAGRLRALGLHDPCAWLGGEP
ncbi:MAG TPA: sigma-70 family RNA polymerase sigma factor [Steroidobacteraceae bacterium]|nr:sigma-70 family RNA polymerase sigma factor [Steroidobacteraceae bacterium]